MDYYIAGFTVGALIAAGLITGAAVRGRRKFGNGKSRKFDERQMLGRGKSFQVGFFTLLIGELLVSLSEYLGILPGASLLWHFGALFLGITVFAVTAIHYDAYLSFMENPRRFFTMGAVICAVTLFSGIFNTLCSTRRNHTIGLVNFELAAVWFVILAALCFHQRSTGGEE